MSSVSVKGGNILISATGFDFSSPHFKISKNPHSPWTDQKPVKLLRCHKGPREKTVAALASRCPAGYTTR